MGHYIPSTREEQQQMLDSIGAQSVAALFADVPASVLRTEPLDLPAGKSELEVRQAITEMAGENKVYGTILRGGRRLSALHSVYCKIYHCQRGICDILYPVSGRTEPGDFAVYF